MSDLLALGYSIHDTLDAIEIIVKHQRQPLDAPERQYARLEAVNCDDLVRLRLAGEHLARIMCALTASGFRGLKAPEPEAVKLSVTMPRCSVHNLDLAGGDLCGRCLEEGDARIEAAMKAARETT